MLKNEIENKSIQFKTQQKQLELTWVILPNQQPMSITLLDSTTFYSHDYFSFNYTSPKCMRIFFISNKKKFQ